MIEIERGSANVYENTGFFTQQVVEKCLKAVALYHGVVFRRTHDLDELVELAHQWACAETSP